HVLLGLLGFGLWFFRCFRHRSILFSDSCFRCCRAGADQAPVPSVFRLIIWPLRGPLRVRALVWVRWPRTGRFLRWRSPDRKSTRLDSSHTEISTLSLHDALPISVFRLIIWPLRGPLRVRALVWVRWPRTGRFLRWRS